MAVYNVSPNRADAVERNARTPRYGGGPSGRGSYLPQPVSRPGTPRYAGRPRGSKIGRLVGGAGYRDPYGNAKAISSSLRPVPQGATADDYLSFISGTNASTEGFIGLGEDPTFTYRQELTGGDVKPYGNLEYGWGPQQTSVVYSQPLYKNGMEYSVMAGMSADAIREWQSFFSGLGFKTGPAGVWSQHEIKAMRAFMGMANQIPGGGITVETLRDQVMNQVRAGIWYFRGVNEEGDLLPHALDEGVAPDLSGGGGGGGGGGTGPGFTEPYTETITRNIVQEFSMEQGMLAIRNHVSQQIGRAPTDEEVKQYVKALNAAFRADPTVITQVTTFDPLTGNEDTDITEHETGVEPEARALEFAEDVSPAERKEYQAGRYFDVLMQAIGM